MDSDESCFKLVQGSCISSKGKSQVYFSVPLFLFFSVSCQSFQLAFLLSQECRCCHLEIYWQSNGFEIRFGIGGCCSFTFFTIFLIHDSNTYHGHGMTFRFDLCLLNVSCGDENKYECFTHYSISFFFLRKLSFAQSSTLFILVSSLHY